MAFGQSAKSTTIEIEAPRIKTLRCVIEGDAPYVQHKMSEKIKRMMMESQAAGETSRSQKKKGKKDFETNFKDAMYVSTAGWNGLPASCFRAAMISACRTIGVPMTRAKLSVFVIADGHDSEGTALVRITRGKPERHDALVRNATGVADIRSRPMWKPGWRATVTIEYDDDMMKAEHVVNLLSRAGRQVGIGEGRPDSKASCGMGWGTFRVLGEGE